MYGNPATMLRESGERYNAVILDLTNNVGMGTRGSHQGAHQFLASHFALIISVSY
jgi:hypothetical protein